MNEDSQMTMRVVAMGAACVSLMACGATLDWENAELPCNREQECAEGYSCLGKTCVRDGSIEQGETCKLSRQCAGDLVCSSYPFFACRPPCNAYYASTENCSAGTYCRPFEDADGQLRGACVQTECEVNEDCGSSEICVPVTQTAKGCLVNCEVSFEQSYFDNCGTLDGQQYCTPIGIPDNQYTVCLETARSGEADPNRQNGQCSPVSDPCARGYACDTEGTQGSGTCRKHCNPDNGDDDCTDVLENKELVCTEKEIGGDGDRTVNLCEEPAE